MPLVAQSMNKNCGAKHMTLVRLARYFLGALSLLLLVPGLSSGIVQAHNPYALSLRLHQSAAGSYIEVYAPTAGVQAAFQKRFSESPTVALDSIEGKQRIVQYFKDTVHLTTPAGPITLGKGLIRVDGHEVSLRLNVTGAEGDIFPLQVHAPCLAENPGELVTFRYISEKGKARVILSEETAFSATLSLGPGGEIQALKASPPQDSK